MIDHTARYKQAEKDLKVFNDEFDRMIRESEKASKKAEESSKIKAEKNLLDEIREMMSGYPKIIKQMENMIAQLQIVYEKIKP